MKKFYAMVVALACTLGASAENYYLIGEINNWKGSDAAWQLSDQGDGTYMLDKTGTTITEKKEFKISNGAWDKGVNYGGNAKSLELYANQSITMVNDKDSKNCIIYPMEDPVFTFNPTTGELSVAAQGGGGDEGDDTIVAFEFYGNFYFDSWGSVETTKNGELWEANVSITGDKKFGIKGLNSKGEQPESGAMKWVAAKSGATKITAVGSYDATNTDCQDFEIAAGNWKLSFDPKNMTLTVSESTYVQDIAYVFYGNFTGTWAPLTTTKNAGSWTASFNNPENPSSFGIKKIDKNAAADKQQLDWLASTEDKDPGNEDAVKEIGAGTVSVKSQGRNFQLPAGNWNLSFNPEAETLTVEDASSSISAVEVEAAQAAPVYYNMQGMRVANPQGVVIVKQGSKVFKQIF